MAVEQNKTQRCALTDVLAWWQDQVENKTVIGLENNLLTFNPATGLIALKSRGLESMDVLICEVPVTKLYDSIEDLDQPVRHWISKKQDHIVYLSEMSDHELLSDIQWLSSNAGSADLDTKTFDLWWAEFNSRPVSNEAKVWTLVGVMLAKTNLDSEYLLARLHEVQADLTQIADAIIRNTNFDHQAFTRYIEVPGFDSVFDYHPRRDGGSPMNGRNVAREKLWQYVSDETLIDMFSVGIDTNWNQVPWEFLQTQGFCDLWDTLRAAIDPKSILYGGSIDEAILVTFRYTKTNLLVERMRHSIHSNSDLRAAVIGAINRHIKGGA